jgi:mannosyl-3-phosphoglycerate phosphatase family protein
LTLVPEMKPIIFTDLDGTLLSSFDSTFESAAPAIERIRKEAIPLVFSSSKTRKEIEVIRERTSNTHPFVSENGGGIFIPEGYFPFECGERFDEGYRVITLGRPYSEVRSALREAGNSLGIAIKGFGDMTVKEVSLATGLTLKEAEAARQRDFDEPFIIEGGKAEGEERLKRAVEGLGFTLTTGRFRHILGTHDKGKALRLLKGFYERLYGEVTTICLGDGANDIPLLKEADYPVLVQKEDGSYEETGLPRVIKANGPGPAGWNSAVNMILDEIERAGLRTG